MASTSPEIAQQIERNGYALVKGHSASQPHLRRGDSKPWRSAPATLTTCQTQSWT